MRREAPSALVEAVTASLGDRLGPADPWEPVAGGDICDAWRVRGARGGDLFVKTKDDAPDGLFAAEAAGLAFLAEPGAAAVPRVVAHRDEPAPAFLVQEWIEVGSFGAGTVEALGRDLATLHRAAAPRFGGAHDPSFIGSVRVDGSPAHSWGEFWAELRLRPLAAVALDRGRLSPELARRVDVVADRIDDLAGPVVEPVRIHGDLWSGNVIADDRGRAWLVDPSAHGGHPETDLAMMRLFGGFPARCYDAYDEVRPPLDGWRERVPLHQLVPLLVHVILFGSGYVSGLSRALDGLGA